MLPERWLGDHIGVRRFECSKGVFSRIVRVA
jgi:hypothetical protein